MGGQTGENAQVPLTRHGSTPPTVCVALVTQRCGTVGVHRLPPSDKGQEPTGTGSPRTPGSVEDRALHLSTVDERADEDEREPASITDRLRHCR